MILAHGNLYEDRELVPLREGLAEACARTMAGPPLESRVVVEACGELARRVEDSVREKISPAALGMVQQGFLTCMEEKELRLDKNGNVLSTSLTATRRMSEETAEIFDSLFL